MSITVYMHALVDLLYKVLLFQKKIPSLFDICCQCTRLSSSNYPTIPISGGPYPVTFGNDDKSHQNKLHNEITVQKWHNFLINIILGMNEKNHWNYVLLNYMYMEIYQNIFKMHLWYDI